MEVNKGLITLRLALRLSLDSSVRRPQFWRMSSFLQNYLKDWIQITSRLVRSSDSCNVSSKIEPAE